MRLKLLIILMTLLVVGCGVVICFISIPRPQQREDPAIKLLEMQTADFFSLLYLDKSDSEIVCLDFTGQIIVWSIQTLQPIRRFVLPGWAQLANHIYAEAHTPETRLLAAGGNHGRFVIAALDNEFKTVEFQAGSQDAISAMVFSSDGKTLALADCHYLNNMESGAHVELWQLQPHRRLTRWKTGNARLRCLGFSQDGKTLACGASDGTVSIWNVESQQQQKTLQGYARNVLQVVYSSDDRFLATCCEDNSIVVWRTSDWTSHTFFTTVGFQFLSLKFLPNSSVLVAGGGNQPHPHFWQVQAYDVEAQKLLGSYRGKANGSVRFLAIPKDRSFVLTGDWKVWLRMIPAEFVLPVEEQNKEKNGQSLRSRKRNDDAARCFDLLPAQSPSPSRPR